MDNLVYRRDQNFLPDVLFSVKRLANARSLEETPVSLCETNRGFVLED